MDSRGNGWQGDRWTNGWQLEEQDQSEQYSTPAAGSYPLFRNCMRFSPYKVILNVGLCCFTSDRYEMATGYGAKGVKNVK